MYQSIDNKNKIVITTKNKFRQFYEARDYVRNLKLQSEVEWDKYIYKIIRRGGKKPKDIPTNPEIVYKDSGWIDFADWLGIEYLDFESARSISKKMLFQSKKEWKRRYFLVFPNDIKVPYSPDEVYKLKGWQDWDHWLGIIKIPYTEDYQDFNDARAFVKTLNLKSIFEWEQYTAGVLSDKLPKPSNIPAHPDEVYNDSEWKGWFYWLGFDMIDFESARRFAKRLSFKNKDDWFDYVYGSNKNNYPIQFDIPDDPSLFYKNCGWINWSDWLGVNYKTYFVDFHTARSFVRSLKLTSRTEWRAYLKNVKISKQNRNDIPAHPDMIYKDRGWNGWNDFLMDDQ